MKKNIHTLKFVINTVPCNTVSVTTLSHHGPAFRLLVDEREKQNKKKFNHFLYFRIFDILINNFDIYEPLH